MTLCGLIYCRDAASRACPGCGSYASVRRPPQRTSIRPVGVFVSTRRGSHQSCRPSRYDRCALQPSSSTATISFEVGRATADRQRRVLSHGVSLRSPCVAGVHRWWCPAGRRSWLSRWRQGHQQTHYTSSHPSLSSRCVPSGILRRNSHADHRHRTLSTAVLRLVGS